VLSLLHTRAGRRFAGLAGALATGAMLAASVPPIDAGMLAWVAFWPLLAALRGRGLGSRLLLGSASGLVFGAGTVGLWLLPAARAHLAASAPSAAALTLTAAWLYGGVYIAALAAIHPHLPRPIWLSTPAAWVLLEWLRGFAAGGAPWALLGHSQHDAVVAQIAELCGVPGVSFLLMLVSASLAATGRERVVGGAAVIAAVAAAVGFGWARLAAIPPADGEAGGVAVVAVSGHNLAADTVAAYARATSAISPAAPRSLVVWPEGATPGYLQEEPAARATIAAVAREHAGLLTGGRRYEGAGRDRRYFNSVFLLDDRGAIAARSDKHRLVPLAESSPLPWLYDLPQPFSPAPDAPQPIDADGLRLGPLVCWDVLYDDLTGALVRRGVDLLVNLSSDRDLGAGAEQLLAFARFRAIETRRWLLRASGTGTSLVVDPAGRVLERDRVRIVPGAERPLTLYVRHGSLLPLAAAFLLAAALVTEWIRARRSRR
jgi:apolipoprotein N-acyltransferase